MEPENRQQLDELQRQIRFLQQLLATIGLGCNLILAAVAAHLFWYRIPGMKEIIVDFDMELAAASQFVFSLPWLPLAVCVLGVILGVVALGFSQRRALLGSWVVAVLGLGAVVFYNYALSQSYHRLIGSMTSP